jgi:hypothetical protein
MAKNFNNSAIKDSFLNSMPQDCIETSDLSTRCKFNFSYLDVSQSGSSFIDINTCAGNSKLVKLIDNLKDFSKHSLKHWEGVKIGKGKRAGKGKRQSVLEIYYDFPSPSELKHPKHVPEDVHWGRFRIDNDTRLCGFMVPPEFSEKCCSKGFNFDVNTFYVVFIDENHEFYLLK